MSDSQPTVPRRLYASLLAIAALSLPATATLILLGVDNTPAPHQQSTQVEAQPQELTLTCLDAQLDAFAPEEVEALTPAIFPTTLRSSEWGTLNVRTADTPAFYALSAPVQGGGELRGLSALPCSQPRISHWFALGNTQAGSDTLIRVVNTGSNSATVTLQLWGSTGMIGNEPHAVTIPAGQAATIQPGLYSPEEQRLAVQLTSDGPGVGAWLTHAQMDGETPHGSTWVDSTQPDTSHTIVGFGPQSSHVRIANPTETDTQVHLTWMTDAGSEPLPGASLELAAGSVSDIALPRVTQGFAALRVDSQSAPVVAQALGQTTGEKWAHTPGKKANWQDLTAFTPSPAVSTATMPSAQWLIDTLDAAAKTPAIRPTSVSTRSGLTIQTIDLVMANPHEAPVAVTIDGATQHRQQLNAGQVASIDLKTLPAQASSQLLTVSSERPVPMSIVIHAKTPTGPLSAVLPVTSETLATASVPVIIQRH